MTAIVALADVVGDGLRLAGHGGVQVRFCIFPDNPTGSM